MNSSENPHAALQSFSALPYSPGPLSDRKHPRSDSGLSDDFKCGVGSFQQNSRRNPRLDHLKHTFPNETQKLALFELKDLPDHVIVTWLALARSGSVGPANDLSATAGLSDNFYTESPLSTSSPGRGILSRDRLGLIDVPSMHSSEPGTVASDDSLLDFHTQTQTPTYPFPAAPAPYETDMSHTRQLATNFPPDPRSQSVRPGDARYKPPGTLNDGGRSSITSIEAPSAHVTSQIRSHSKDRVKWSCTLCEHDTFRGKQEWIRHERNQHFPRHVYYCQPDIIVRNNELYCMECKIENPGCNHIAKCDAHACALKDFPARRFASKEKFIKHLRSHELHNDCRQLDEWKRLLPEQVWGCGFCVRVFDDVEERLFHISRHFERGMTRADWDASRVVLSLLTLPYIANAWVWRLNLELSSDQAWPEISWTKENAMALQRRVSSGQESGTELAESAFHTSIVGGELQRRKQRLEIGFPSLNPDSSVGYLPVEPHHVINQQASYG